MKESRQTAESDEVRPRNPHVKGAQRFHESAVEDDGTTILRCTNCVQRSIDVPSAADPLDLGQQFLAYFNKLAIDFHTDVVLRFIVPVLGEQHVMRESADTRRVINDSTAVLPARHYREIAGDFIRREVDCALGHSVRGHRAVVAKDEFGLIVLQRVLQNSLT